MKKTIALVLAGSLTLALAGCAAATDTEADAAQQAATLAAEAVADNAAEAATAVAEAAQSGELSAAIAELAGSKAASDGELTVGLNATFPPFEYVGADGQPTGFDVAMMNEIGARLGLKVVIEDMDFDGIVAAIGNKVDVGATGMTITEERKEAVNFSEPYYDATQSVLLKADSTIATADDLAAASIECQSGTTGEGVARGISDANTVSVKSFNQAVMDLVNGKCEAVVIDAVPAEAFVTQYPDDLKIVTGDVFGFDVEQYGIAMPKDDAALKVAIDVALASMKADGTYDKLVDEWINNYEAQ